MNLCKPHEMDWVVTVMNWTLNQHQTRSLASKLASPLSLIIKDVYNPISYTVYQDIDWLQVEMAVRGLHLYAVGV